MNTTRSVWTAAAALASALALASCAAPLNFTHPSLPRYAGCGEGADAPSTAPDPSPARGGAEASADVPALRVVTFNVQYAQAVGAAIAFLRGSPELRPLDILFLQEMDAPGVRRIAGAFGLCYVYYPATVEPQTGRPFGPAILSRWPLVDDRKLILPHRGRVSRTQRIAVAATVLVRGRPVRLYSVHLATPLELGPGSRRDQVRALLADADTASAPVIIGGDLNAWGLGKLLERDGYAWPTRGLGHTRALGDVDHIFVRGLPAPDSSGAGKVPVRFGASDHDAVWVTVRL